MRFAHAAHFCRVPDLNHARAVLAAGIKAADAYMLRHDDEAIRIDRALSLWSINDFGRAADEFRALGKSTHDKRFTRLAQIASQRSKGLRR